MIIDTVSSNRYENDPYGVPVLTSGGTGNGISQNPYQFAGGIQDRATGWVKYGARWYNPTTGRWTQQDTLDNPLDPANANRYAYAGNDPINNIDATGRYLTPCQSSGVNLAAGTVGRGLGHAGGIAATLSGVGTPAGLAILGGLAVGTTTVLTGYNDFSRDCIT